MKRKTLAVMLASTMLFSAAMSVCTAAAAAPSITLTVGDAEALPGEVVQIPVQVMDDSDGINSYIVSMKIDEMFLVADAKAGDAYEALDFASNLETLTFGGTNYSVAENLNAEANATLFTVDFKIPEDAKPGKYDINLSTVDFYDMDMNLLTVTPKVGSITVSGVGSEDGGKLGDVDEDGNVNAVDAANILVAAATVGAGGDITWTDTQKKNADVDGNGSFNSTDAAYILMYAAEVGAGYTGSIEEFMASLS